MQQPLRVCIIVATGSHNYEASQTTKNTCREWRLPMGMFLTTTSREVQPAASWHPRTSAALQVLLKFIME